MMCERDSEKYVKQRSHFSKLIYGYAYSIALSSVAWDEHGQGCPNHRVSNTQIEGLSTEQVPQQLQAKWRSELDRRTEMGLILRTYQM